MRKTMTLLLLAALALVPGQAAAELCTIDAVPAATLLVPYFEVDLSGGGGVDTLFSINNASAEPTVAHVTLWGDWSQPTITFDVFLTGYDVETISLKNILVFGNLPITAHAEKDPVDVLSPHGGAISDNPAWDSAPDNGLAQPRFMGCDGFLPFGSNPVLTGALFDRVNFGHTGRPLDGVTPNLCVGKAFGDNIARGYVTIDNVKDCSITFPTESGYYGPAGVLSDVNQLWGDWFIINRAAGFAQGDNLVHIEAATGGGFAAGDYTFYGRYVSGLGTDQREPLASTWAARYLSGGVFDGGTDLLVWRDSKCMPSALTYPCAGLTPDPGPPWFPLDETQVVAFDLAEQAAEVCTGSGLDFCFPVEAQRVAVGLPPLDPPYEFGWLYLNLNHTLNTGGGCTTDGLFGDIAQSWVVNNMKAFASQFTVGSAAQQLGSACNSSGTNTCSIDSNPCVLDADCEGGATSVGSGDVCLSSGNPIVGFNP